jgi:FMN phosphatase YigB (HAD superfamily)
MTPIPAVVFDVDGTIANNDHRRHFVLNKPRDWKNFNANIWHDTPHEDIVELVKIFYSHYPILICTARTGDLLDITREWLDEVAGLQGFYEKIYIRGEKDYKDDQILKVELLEQIRADGYEPKFWIDDRQRVVDAIRAQGIRVLQVCEGNF